MADTANATEVEELTEYTSETPAEAGLGDQTADDALGYFLDREGLNICVLQEGGVQCTVRYWTGAWEAEQLLNLLCPPRP